MQRLHRQGLRLSIEWIIATTPETFSLHVRAGPTTRPRNCMLLVGADLVAMLHEVRIQLSIMYRSGFS